MLISFSIENWQCFRDKVTLSMVKTAEQQHGERLPSINGKTLLPAAAIYGGNASGKTKFFNAFEFAQRFVTIITQPENSIPRDHFRLDPQCAIKPSTFTFEFLIKDTEKKSTCYEFSFSVNDRVVVEEKLIKILPRGEKILYHREPGKKINFPDDIELQKDQRLQFVADGVRENILFLSTTVDQKFKYFKPIYDWFKHELVLLNPFSSFEFFDSEVDYEELSSFLSEFDTGIDSVGLEDISFQIHESVKKNLLQNLMEGMSARVANGWIFKKENGDISVKKLVSYHQSMQGEKIPFEINRDESTGTQRIINLAPYFLDLIQNKKPKLYVVDELDRCLHTLATKALLERYLSSCSKDTRSQLLFTTHDVLLMDQKLLRRDEIWINERDMQGNSSLFSLAEYKDVRNDKDIRKSYLQGRFGGIPKIFLQGLNLTEK